MLYFLPGPGPTVPCAVAGCRHSEPRRGSVAAGPGAAAAGVGSYYLKTLSRETEMMGPTPEHRRHVKFNISETPAV